MSSKVKIILHGYLKKLYPGELELSGRTVAELINGMCKQTKAFDVPLDRDRHSISVVGFTTSDSLYQPISPDLRELHLVPSLMGGKKGGFFQIVLGTVLIAAAVFLSPAVAPGATAAWATAGTVQSIAFNLGIALVLGGLIQLVSPAPRMDTTGSADTDPEASRYLGSRQNTVRIGTRIPLFYGRAKVFGHYISFNVDAKDVALR